MKQVWLFFVGLGVMAAMIGLLTGLSYSPVVGTLIPLLFTLITAGGAYYSKNRVGAQISGFPITNPVAYGIALIVFSISFGIGAYFGVAAKFHSDKVWFANESPAITDTEFKDFRLLAVALELDLRMRNAGLDVTQRKSILDNLLTSMKSRSEKRLSLLRKRQDIAKLATEGEIEKIVSEINRSIEILSDLYTEIDDFDEESYTAISESLERIKALSKVSTIEDIYDSVAEFEAAHEEVEKSGLLSEDELKAIEPLIPDYSRSLSGARSPVRAIASDFEIDNLLKDG